MPARTPYDLKQKYLVDPKNRMVYTKINESFHNASKILNWPFKSEGLGINHEIITVTLANNYTLSVVCNEKIHRFSWQTIRKTLKTLNTDYVLKHGIPLTVLPVIMSYDGETSIDRFM